MKIYNEYILKYMEIKMKKTIVAIMLLNININAETYYLVINDKNKGVQKYSVEKISIWENSTSTFTEWINLNVAYEFSLYIPEISIQTNDFIQQQTNKQDQHLFEQPRIFEEATNSYKNSGEPIEHTQTINKTNNRTVNVVAEDWSSVGGIINCQDWSPLENSILFGEEFSQSRQCEQDETRDIEYYIESTLENTLTFNQTSLVVENQQAFGSNSDTGWIITDSTFGEWINEGEGYDHLEWTPKIVEQLVDFSQSRDYSQNQKQTEQPREQNSFTLEYRNNGEEIIHPQVILESENRDIIVEVGEFIDNNAPYDCIDWTPTVDTVVYGQTFEQNRDCQQEQIANVSYKTNAIEIQASSTDKIISINGTQEATGTNDSSGWTTHTSIISDWVNDGEGYGHETYLPVIDNQISNFSQSRNYSQDQIQTEQPREINTFTNEIRNNGEEIILPQTIIENEDRNIIVQMGDFVDNNAPYDCLEWTPMANTILYGQSFEQNRDCQQDQTANISYKAEDIEVGISSIEQTITRNEIQPEIGTNLDSGWVTIGSTFTNWVNSGTSYDIETYLPVINNQTSAFTQSRNYKIKQVSNEQPREQNTYNNVIRNIGTPFEIEQVLNKIQNRSVTVEVGSYSNVGSYINCEGWTPSTDNYFSNVNVNQTNDCDIEQERIRVFKVGSTTISNKTDSQTVSSNQSRTVSGTKFQSYEFNTNGNSEGWSHLYHITNPNNSPISGYLEGLSTSLDPMFQKSSLSIDSSSVSKITVRARFKNSPHATMQLFWRSSTTGGLNETNSIKVSINKGSTTTYSSWKEYTFNVDSKSGWDGTINLLRLDPFQAGTASDGGSYVQIDYIRLIK
jgi:hypothetical protein